MVPHRPQQRRGERARPQAALNDGGAREDIGEVDNIPYVLGVNNLGSPGHLADEISQRGPYRQHGVSFVGAVPASNVLTDQLGVVQSAQMAMKRLTVGQCKHVAPQLPVQQQGQVAGLKAVLIGLFMDQNGVVIGW